MTTARDHLRRAAGEEEAPTDDWQSKYEELGEASNALGRDALKRIGHLEGLLREARERRAEAEAALVSALHRETLANARAEATIAAFKPVLNRIDRKQQMSHEAQRELHYAEAMIAMTEGSK